MKFTKSIMITLALLISVPASASYFCNKYTKAAAVAAIGIGAYILYTKQAQSQEELDAKRSILDEKSPIDACCRVVNEEIIGQLENSREDKPATGIVGNCHKMVKDTILPVTGAIVLIEKTCKKLRAGLKSFGLDFVADWIIEVPSYPHAEQK